MMENTEIIKALRCCASPDTPCKGLCSYHGVEYCLSKKDLDAADALEAAEKRIAELESNNPIVESVLVDKLNQRIAELEAQLPKEGEWIDANGADVPLDKDGDTTDSCYCSICGDWLTASDEYATRGRYCPNCGAKMKGENDADN